MKKLLFILLLLALCVCPAFAGARDTNTKRMERRPPQNAIRPRSFHLAQVLRVVNGNTFLVMLAGGAKPERVRLIGVDTPGVLQNYGQEVSDFVTTLLTNRDVWLEFDVQTRDRNRRLLAYLWTARPRESNGREDMEEEIRRNMFNARLILEGYAQAAASRPNSRYARLFAKFQREAREENRGLWW